MRYDSREAERSMMRGTYIRQKPGHVPKHSDVVIQRQMDQVRLTREAGWQESCMPVLKVDDPYDTLPLASEK